MHAPNDLHVRKAQSSKVHNAPMSAHAAIKLVDLLATSDEFRDEFMRDTRTALESWHFDQHTIDYFWFDCRIGITQLAPKETIAAAREEILAMLMFQINQTVPRLDTGLETQRRLRR